MEVQSPMETMLAADIGGTKCEVAVFALEGDDYQPLAVSRYPSRRYGGIAEIIALFLEESGFRPYCACLGVAGVTGRERATVTNLPWVVDSRQLAETFGFSRVALLNDMTAVCASLAILGDQDWLELQPGDGEGGELTAVIAPGTGLGEGLLFRSAEVFFPCGSEGGHADFAPVDGEQEELLRWMLRRGGRVSYEDLIAGPGIPLLHDFLRQSGGVAGSPEVEALLRDAADRTPVIVDAAIRDLPCPLCRRTLELFLAILGSEAGNLALKVYAKGGVYVGGGIVPRLIGRLSFAGFLENFRRKGKMEQLMASFPVRLITHRSAALLGVARYGRATFAGSPGRA